MPTKAMRLAAAIGAPVLEAAGSDSVACPRGCGERLIFRSNPFQYGRTESRCDRCGTPWRPVPRIHVAAERKETWVARSAANPKALREAIRVSLPTRAAEAQSCYDVARVLKCNPITAWRHLHAMRSAGQVKAKPSGRRVRFWRAAA